MRLHRILSRTYAEGPGVDFAYGYKGAPTTVRVASQLSFGHITAAEHMPLSR